MAKSGTAAPVFKDFIFGYGSLICGKSRAVTAPTLADRFATPVLVPDVARVWSVPTPGLMTAMGVRFQTGARCVGVLVPVSPVELSQFDQREAPEYKRVTLQHVEKVDYLKDDWYSHPQSYFQQQNNEAANIWMYLPKEQGKASEDAPIPQSYVDIILRGCLSISEEYCKEVIRTTQGWSNQDFTTNDIAATWVEDREDPIYIRADVDYSTCHGEQLDQLLCEHCPDFGSRRPISGKRTVG